MRVDCNPSSNLDICPFHKEQSTLCPTKLSTWYTIMHQSTAQGTQLITPITFSTTNLFINPAVHNVSIPVEPMKWESIQQFVSAVCSLQAQVLIASVNTAKEDKDCINGEVTHWRSTRLKAVRNIRVLKTCKGPSFLHYSQQQPFITSKLHYPVKLCSFLSGWNNHDLPGEWSPE